MSNTTIGASTHPTPAPVGDAVTSMFRVGGGGRHGRTCWVRPRKAYHYPLVLGRLVLRA